MTDKEMLLREQARLAEDPARACVEVNATSRLVAGFESRVRTRTSEVTVDQPAAAGGTDLGPRPSGYALAALAACHEVTYRLYADALDIPLRAVAVTVTGYSDARGFLCPDSEARAGFERVRGTAHIDSPASEADTARLRETVDRHCPVLDELRSPVDAELDVVRCELPTQ